MCLPASAACTIRSACVSVDEQISTASIARVRENLRRSTRPPAGFRSAPPPARAASRLTSAIATARRLGQAEGDGLGVHLADASGADDSDIQFVDAHELLLDSAVVLSIERRYSRLRRALSFGAPMPGSTSCSTSA